jgi:hypothetical protein
MVLEELPALGGSPVERETDGHGVESDREE